MNSGQVFSYIESLRSEKEKLESIKTNISNVKSLINSDIIGSLGTSISESLSNRMSEVNSVNSEIDNEITVLSNYAAKLQIEEAEARRRELEAAARRRQRELLAAELKKTTNELSSSLNDFKL